MPGFPTSANTHCRRLLIVGLLGLVLGCGPTNPETAVVKGKVTYLNMPVTNGTVLLTPEGSGNAATGELQADGTFQLTTFQKNDGAIPGKYKVSLQVNPPEGGGLPGQEFASGKPPIPLQYTSPGTSDLTVTITRGENNLDLRLKD